MATDTAKTSVTQWPLSAQQALWLLLTASTGLHLFFIWYFGDIDFEPDSYYHFIFSVSAFADLPNSLNWAVGVWPKPIFTLLMGLVIWLTHIEALWIVKCVNVLIWLGVSLLGYRLARQLTLSTTASLVAVFLIQTSFLGFRAAIGTLTEPLFALLALAAIVALYDKRYTTSCLLISLSGLARPEGMLLLPGWVIILWFFHSRRHFWDLIWLGLFPLLWNLWGYAVTDDPTFILSSGYPSGSPYGQGSWLYYPKGLLQYEPLLFPLAIAGGLLALRQKRYDPLHLLTFIFFGFNILAWRWGRFGTAGLLRYFVPVLPWLAVYAAVMIDALRANLQARQLLKWGLLPLAGQLGFTVLVLLSGTSGYRLYNTPTVDQIYIDAGRWIQTTYPDRYLYTAHPAVYYYAGRNFYTSAPLANDTIFRHKTIVAFDTDFAPAELKPYLADFPQVNNFADRVFIYEHDLTAIAVPLETSFGEVAIKPYLQDGWSAQESWGIWAVGPKAEMRLYVPTPQPMAVIVRAFPHYIEGQQQAVKLYYNDALIADFTFPANNPDPQQIVGQIPAHLISGGADRLTFAFAYAQSPASLGGSSDARELAAGFLEIKIRPAMEVQ